MSEYLGLMLVRIFRVNAYLNILGYCMSEYFGLMHV